MAATAEAEAPAKPKKSIVKTLLTLIGAAALGGGGFAAGQFLNKEQLTPAEEVLRLIEQSSTAAGGGEMAKGEAADGEAGGEEMAEMPDKNSDFEIHYHQFPEKLTTNLAGSRRFLQVELGVSTHYDKKVVENVIMHVVALKSDVLSVMSGFSEEDITGKEGRDALAIAIRDAINERLEKEEGFGGIEDVFFSSFVLQ